MPIWAGQLFIQSMNVWRIECPVHVDVTEESCCSGTVCILHLIRHCGDADFSCDRVKFPSGQEFQLISDDGFSQWIYLGLAESFVMAVQDFVQEHPLLCYVLFSEGFRDGDMFEWVITVNYLEAVCSVSGIRMSPRTFNMRFSEIHR